MRKQTRDPADYGLSRCALRTAGADAHYNAQELRRVLRGESRGAHRDALLLGAALALEVSGRETLPKRRSNAPQARSTVARRGTARAADRLVPSARRDHELGKARVSADFLTQMAQSSRERTERARALCPEAVLREQAAASAPVRRCNSRTRASI